MFRITLASIGRPFLCAASFDSNSPFRLTQRNKKMFEVEKNKGI